MQKDSNFIDGVPNKSGTTMHDGNGTVPCLDAWLVKLQVNLRFADREELNGYLASLNPEQQSWLMKRHDLPLDSVFEYLGYAGALTKSVPSVETKTYSDALKAAFSSTLPVNKAQPPDDNEWVDCAERLPDRDEAKVVVLSPFAAAPPGVFLASYVVKVRKWLLLHSGMEFSDQEGVITHWMRLPECPKPVY